LGFLSTEDDNCPGNYGFKDQSFVLKWIHDNIEHFNGDKESVTIWGGEYAFDMFIRTVKFFQPTSLKTFNLSS